MGLFVESVLPHYYRVYAQSDGRLFRSVFPSDDRFSTRETGRSLKRVNGTDWISSISVARNNELRLA